MDINKVETVQTEEPKEKLTERKSWKDVIAKSKGIIEETKAVENNNPWDEKFDKRDEVAKKIQAFFNLKLLDVNKDPIIEEMMKNNTFLVEREVGVRLPDKNGNRNTQKQYVRKRFLDYRKIIPDEVFAEIAISLKNRIFNIEHEIEMFENRLKDVTKEYQQLKQKYTNMSKHYVDEKGVELLPQDLDNNEEFVKLKTEVSKHEELITVLKDRIRNMKIMVMDVKDVKNSVESHDIAVTEPIIASRILLNMIAVFSHDENLDEKTKEIFTDEKLNQEATEENIKRVIDVNSVDSMNVEYLNMKEQEAFKDSLVNELFEEYFTPEGIKDINELIEEGAKLNCKSDIQKEIVQHLYENPNSSEDELGALIRKKDENGVQIPISQEFLNGIPVLLTLIEQYTFNGEIYNAVKSMEAFNGGLGEIYFPIYKNTLEPLADGLFPNIESKDKKRMLLLYLAISCFKINTIPLLFMLLTKVNKVEIKEENK